MVRDSSGLINALWMVCFFMGAHVFTVCFSGYVGLYNKASSRIGNLKTNST